MSCAAVATNCRRCSRVHSNPVELIPRCVLHRTLARGFHARSGGYCLSGCHEQGRLHLRRGIVGGSWGDLNGDHRPDLFSNHHRNKASVFVNRGNDEFDDVASDVDLWDTPAGALIDMHGGAWADFDNDGDLDLYVSAGRSNDNQFFRNDAGRLVDVTAQLDPGVPNLRGRMPVWFDFTGDGLLDFFLSAESSVPLFARSGAGFVNRTNEAGFTCPNRDRDARRSRGRDPAGGALHQRDFRGQRLRFSTMPFTRVTTSLPKTSWVNDVVADDFNGDLKTDVFVLRGRTRLSGALQRSPTAAAFQLITQGGAEKRGRFASSGNVTFVVSTSGWNMTPGNIFIGSGGQRPPSPVVDFRRSHSPCNRRTPRTRALLRTIPHKIRASISATTRQRASGMSSTRREAFTRISMSMRRARRPCRA